MIDAMDRTIISAMASMGMAAHIDAVYTPPDSGEPVDGVYVAVDDLESETTGEITQGGAVLYLLRSQVGIPVQGSTVQAGGVTWRIGRRLASTDPSMIAVEARK